MLMCMRAQSSKSVFDYARSWCGQFKTFPRLIPSLLVSCKNNNENN